MDEGIGNRWQAYQAEMMDKVIHGKRTTQIWTSIWVGFLGFTIYLGIFRE